MLEKEIIELLKLVVTNAEPLIALFIMLNFFSHIITCATWIACFYWFGRGIKGLGWWIDENI